MQMQQMQQMQMPAYQQRPNAYAYPAAPQQQPVPQQYNYAPVTAYTEQQIAVSVNEEKQWNHQENEACLFIKARFCEKESTLREKRNIEVDCRSNSNLLKELVKHKRGAQTDISGNIHKGVMINKISVVGCQSTLPHPVGVRFADITTWNYFDGQSGEGFSFIIPANLPNYKFLDNIPIYQANKESQGALAGKYGGLDFDKLKKETTPLSENTVFVPRTSIAVDAALDAHYAIVNHGLKSANGKYRINPELVFVPAGKHNSGATHVLHEIEGKIQMSAEFFNGFLRSVQENVMSVTKPVDLDCLSVSFFNTNHGFHLADKEGTLLEGEEDDDSRVKHEVVVDFVISFNTRNNI